MATATQNPRYEAHENPPWRTSLGFGLQFSMIASATLLVTPVIVAEASGRGESYVTWMVFASLVAVGLSTLVQVRRLGPVGAGAVMPFFTAAFAIPFCITAVVDGGPATLTTLVLASAAFQFVVARWLFILRRLVTPVVSGTVMMILSITLASVVFDLLDGAAREEPTAAPLTALATLTVVAALTLRGSALWRLWAPMIGIAVGCVVAAAFGIYDTSRITQSAWVGLPSEAPGLALDLGVDFWTLLPAFLFLGVIVSIQVNGEAITHQRISQREVKAVDFRQVQGALAGGGVSNLLAGLAGTVPNATNPGITPFIQVTGIASRRMGYVIGAIFIAVAFLPKVSGLLSSLPGPVMTGYLIVVTGTLFVDGALTVINSERNRQKLIVAGISFWIAAAFQFGLFTLPNLTPVLGALVKSGITTGGVAAIVMILFLEFTKKRRMRFESKLDAEVLPDLFAFTERFAESRGWDQPMKERLSAVAEETLLTLAPLDLSLDLADEDDEQETRRLVVLASSDGPIADLEFIGGGDEENMEDRIRQLQQHDEETVSENEISLRLLRRYASSVRHQQFHGSDIITVRVGPPGTR
ncbi:MAG: purine/pyrimidine permease [Chloroflexi bacterium]|nr:purine/pyrimidine permease [Chloroflexota bacterium]